MIRTDAEHREAIERLQQDTKHIHALKEQLESAGITGEQLDRALEPSLSFREQLKDEVEAYEQIKRGDLGVLFNLTSIGRWLIGARIANGMTQRELAEALGVDESQVSRDERNEYHGISIERAQKILDVLGVRFQAKASNPLVDKDMELEYA